MLEFRRVKQQSLLLQVLQNHRVRLFHENASVGGLLCHLALSVDKLYKRQLILSADIGIILTKRRGNVYDASTVCHCDIRVTSDKMRLFVLLFNDACRKVKQRYIRLVL